jgi:hypothetical protein
MSKTENKEKSDFYERLWSSEEKEPEFKQAESDHFYTGPAEGPTVAPLTILECLKLFITDEMMQKIVFNTNQYHLFNERFKLRRKEQQNNPITVQELWIFFALKITISN